MTEARIRVIGRGSETKVDKIISEQTNGVYFHIGRKRLVVQHGEGQNDAVVIQNARTKKPITNVASGRVTEVIFADDPDKIKVLIEHSGESVIIYKNNF